MDGADRAVVSLREARVREVVVGVGPGDGAEPAHTAVVFKPERFSIRALGSEELPWHTDEPLLPAAEWGFADAR